VICVIRCIGDLRRLKVPIGAEAVRIGERSLAARRPTSGDTVTLEFRKPSNVERKPDPIYLIDRVLRSSRSPWPDQDFHPAGTAG
jgi:hypothetical protein